MATTTMHRAVAGASVLLLLTGCVPTRELPPVTPTEAELEQWVTRSDGLLWETTGLDDSLRPASIEHQYVESSDWVQWLSICMFERGYNEYDVDKASRMFYSFDPAVEVVETIDWYECQVTYQVNPGEYGLMGGAMHDYLYRYNTSILVPCLEGKGVRVGYVPTLQEAGFDGEYFNWNPYFWLRETFNPDVRKSDRLVYEACPPFPDDPVFDSMREIW